MNPAALTFGLSEAKFTDVTNEGIAGRVIPYGLLKSSL
jgi:hypothetical protein